MNAELPKDFFADVMEAKAQTNVFGNKPGTKPATAMAWYDGIIDDILANPGTSIKDTAARLGRSPNTISVIMNSDLFKARWEQRRAQFNMALDLHLSQKLAAVAEKALEHTIKALDTKRENVPLPILKDLALGSLDRLGYGPKAHQPVAAVQVNVNSGAASPEALESARAKMRELELRSSVAGPEESKPGEGD